MIFLRFKEVEQVCFFFFFDNLSLYIFLIYISFFSRWMTCACFYTWPSKLVPAVRRICAQCCTCNESYEFIDFNFEFNVLDLRVLYFTIYYSNFSHLSVCHLKHYDLRLRSETLQSHFCLSSTISLYVLELYKSSFSVVLSKYYNLGLSSTLVDCWFFYKFSRLLLYDPTLRSEIS